MSETVPEHRAKTRAERRREQKARLAKEIETKLSSIGRAQFVATQRAPPARQATKKLQQGDYHDFVTIKEAWMLHLLHHLMSESSHIVPPTPVINLASALSLPFKFLGFTAGTSFSPGTLNWGEKLHAHDASFIDPVRPLLDGHEMNYIPVEGRVFVTTTIVGNDKKYIWVDPFDFDEPLKINSGPDINSIQGSFASSAPYDGVLANGRSSESFAWSAGYDPRLVPTEWVNIEGLDQGSNDVLIEQLYPPFESWTVSSVGSAAMFRATNLIEWVCDMELIVSVANPTAFSATAIRARTQDSTQHRFSERVERPAYADYGFTGPFVTSNLVETRWRGCSWSVPYIHRNNIGIAPWVQTLPTFEVNTEARMPRGSANWNSLQRCLSEMIPLVEIQQNADSPTRSVDLSIEVRIKKCIVPVFTPTASLSSEHLTFPAKLPKWYQPLSYEASVCPVDGSVRHSTVPYTMPMQSQLNRAAVAAVRSDMSDHKAIQALALTAPPLTNKPVETTHKTFLEKLNHAGSLANNIVHQAADTANTGWGIAKGLHKIGNEIWSGLRNVAGFLGRGAARAVPLVEEAATAVPLLL